MAYVFAAVVEYAVANFIKKPEIDRLARRVFPISFSLLRNHAVSNIIWVLDLQKLTLFIELLLFNVTLNVYLICKKFYQT